MVKDPPANVADAGVWSLGWEDPLEEGMSTHSSILAWEIPWTKEPRGLESMGSQRVGHNWTTEHAHTLFLVSHLVLTLAFGYSWCFHSFVGLVPSLAVTLCLFWTMTFSSCTINTTPTSALLIEKFFPGLELPFP